MKLSELLPSGPELDALIAERVLGWRRSPHVANQWNVPLEDPKGAYIELSGLSPFSKNMDSAWCVVERMSALGFIIEIAQYGIFDSGSEWYAHFDEKSSRGGRGGHGQDKSVSMAICYAALYALGVWKLP